jgi:hypothetical protein
MWTAGKADRAKKRLGSLRRWSWQSCVSDAVSDHARGRGATRIHRVPGCQLIVTEPIHRSRRAVSHVAANHG